MTSPTRGTLIALSFVVVPVIVVIASAGVIVLPSIEESRALEEKILAVQAQLELADEAEEALWNFAQDGTTELEVITAWETTHIPAEETDRERYELLRDYATLSGVELISVVAGPLRPLLSPLASSDSRDRELEDLDLDEEVSTDPGEGANPRTRPEDHSAVPLHLVVEGPLSGVLHLLDFIQLGPRLFTMEGMDVTAGQSNRIRAELDVSAVLRAATRSTRGGS